MKKKKNSHKNMDALLFIDANILLDFYRESDVSMDFLEQMCIYNDRLILNSQLEMEYKKNRQGEIIKSLKGYSMPDLSAIKPPVVAENIQAAKMIDKIKKDLSKQRKTVEEKIEKSLVNPSYHDPVYKSLKKIFEYDGPYNLSRKNERRFEIRELAYKRFLLGYPPRKKNDTSYGDAIHWEWIVQCAVDSGKSIVIVSRDSDFGHSHKGKSYLNDWLSQEFKERVGARRKIKLTRSLSEGLKIIHAKVTEEMMEAERKILNQPARDYSIPSIEDSFTKDEQEQIMKNLYPDWLTSLGKG